MLSLKVRPDGGHIDHARGQMQCRLFTRQQMGCMPSIPSRMHKWQLKSWLSQAAELAAEIQKDKLAGLMRKAAQAHPNCTLGILVEGFAHYCQQRERREEQLSEE